MSDFEYECNDNTDNEEDDVSYDGIYDYDDDDDCDNCDDCNDTKLTTSTLIDMDDDTVPIHSISPITLTTPAKPKLILKQKNIDNTLNSIINNSTPIDTQTIDIDTSQKKEITETKAIPETKEKKLTKIEQSFEYNQETIDFFTQHLDFKKILIKNSPFTNDTQVICLLLKYKVINEYCCSVKKCKVKTVWLDKPLQLILHRKNNIQNDLSICNLELICGNCYLSLYGLDIFKKKEKEIILLCEFCKFPLVKFNNTRKKKGTCLACEKKMNKVFNENIDNDYYNNIKVLYNDNPLLSDETKHINYTNNSSKYKPSSTSSKPPSYLTTNQSSQSEQKTDTVKSQDKPKPKPIIKLNMKIPNIDDLFKQ
jgi:hypothetical protein